MQIETITIGKRTVLKLRGRLDVTWADHVLNQALELLRDGNHDLCIDAAELDYLSSAGIRVLIQMRRDTSMVKGQFGVINPSPFVANTLRMSGLESLLLTTEPELEPESVSRSDQASEVQTTQVDDVAFRIHPLQPDGRLQVHTPVAWVPWQPVADASLVNVSFPTNVFGLGIGVPGSSPGESRTRLGEFVAVAGCLAYQPTDGSEKPDFLLQAKQFVPSLFAAQAMVAEGTFSHLLRFAPAGKSGRLLLGELFDQALAITDSDTVALVCMAEIEGLVGTTLLRSPGRLSAEDHPADFPTVRDWVAFCGDRVHARHAAIVTAFASRRPSDKVQSLLSPLPSKSGLFTHAHAVVMPFRPLPEGVLDLSEQVAAWYQEDSPIDLLHLIDDNRPAIGLGQSAFLRGACWCSPCCFGKDGRS